jgi:hypothetical protein
MNESNTPMKTHIRTTLSGLSLIAVMAGALWIISPRKVGAEAADLQIPPYVKGKQFSIAFENGDTLMSIRITSVVYIQNEPWWIVQLPSTTEHVKFENVTINPRQIRSMTLP